MPWRPEGLGSSGNITRGEGDTQFQEPHHSAVEEPVLGFAGALVWEWLLRLILAALSGSSCPVRYINYLCAHTDPPQVVCHSLQMEGTLEDLASHADEKLHTSQFCTSSSLTALSITSTALSSWALHCRQQQILKVLPLLNIYYLSVCQASITKGGSGNYRR